MAEYNSSYWKPLCKKKNRDANIYAESTAAQIIHTTVKMRTARWENSFQAGSEITDIRLNNLFTNYLKIGLLPFVGGTLFG